MSIIKHYGLSDMPAAVREGTEATDLWVRGQDPDRVFDLDRPVAIVGARASTAYGDHQAARIADGLATTYHTIVSGGGFGIDSVAHRAAVARATPGTVPTVVVLPGGVDVAYPRTHQGLLDRVLEAGGLLVSINPPGSPPSRGAFLARNGVIAALATEGMIVVEAIMSSGSMNAARQAREMGRTVMAVPGPVTSVMSEGTNALIRDGAARLVTNAHDVMEVIGK